MGGLLETASWPVKSIVRSEQLELVFKLLIFTYPGVAYSNIDEGAICCWLSESLVLE